MMKPAAAFLLIFFSLSQPVWAKSISLPSGIAIDPPKELDVTYQLFPAFDEKEKVVAGWNDGKLEYYLTILKLPPGYTDAKTYLVRFAHDVGKLWGGIELGKQVTYKADGNLTVTAIEISKPEKSKETPRTTQSIHFMTDGKLSYVAIVRVVPPSAPDDVFDTAISLLQTAKIESSVGSKEAYEGDELEGTWTTQDTAPDGNLLTGRMELQRNSFSAIVSVGGKGIIFAATGAWQKSGSTLHWTYFDSKPELPAESREDEDDIVSYDESVLVLKSHLTGKVRTFRREKSIPK